MSILQYPSFGMAWEWKFCCIFSLPCPPYHAHRTGSTYYYATGNYRNAYRNEGGTWSLSSPPPSSSSSSSFSISISVYHCQMKDCTHVPFVAELLKRMGENCLEDYYD